MKRLKIISAYLAGVATAGLGAVGVVANAAVGDVAYEPELPSEGCISKASAAAIADVLIAQGIWDGDRSDMLATSVSRVPADQCSSGVWAAVKGLKRGPISQVPNKSVIHAGVVEE